MFRTFIFFLSCFVLNNIIYSQTPDSVVLKDGLAIRLARGKETRVITPNKIIAAMETGKWSAPSENEKLESDGEIIGTWKKIHADESGWFSQDTLFNAYVFFNYKSDKEEIILLEVMGDDIAYVNGAARSGNPYREQDNYEEGGPRFDYSLIPVKLKKGDNEFLFGCNRTGILKVKINKIKPGLILNKKDLTIPDIILNENADTYGALPVINATEKSRGNLYIKTWSGSSEPAYFPICQIMPLSIHKSQFTIKLPPQQATGAIKLNISLVSKASSNEEILDESVIELNVVKSEDTHKETFISKMDGSVQYYAVVPPVDLRTKPALFLSLHGAGVEAINQAQAYAHKNWGYIVAPTNRRPYGFNWENWGRMDALEVFNIAKKKYDIDENRVYLTGHSMGGHGTWQLGINYSDKFAAIGPSAGWISIWGYRIGNRTDTTMVTQMLMRSAKHSDTYAFSTNLKNDGVYVLQGSADDNVYPEQARSMIDNLSKFHKDYIYHEEPGMGHWWDISDELGVDCVDYMPMFEFFSHHAIPNKDMVRVIDFVTANPTVSSKNNWIEIINQEQQQKLSKINIRLEYYNRKFAGTTDNIQLLEIDASVLPKGKPVAVELDSQLVSGIEIPADNIISLHKDNGKWTVGSKFKAVDKNPVRCGNFREALNYNVVFVIGTHGNKEENNWAFEKARYDGEKLWYQGNSSIEIIKDDEFDLVKYKDRSVILFGNSKTNSAWKLLLKDSPVQVDNNMIVIGKNEYKGGDLVCLMIRPRTDSEFASVAVVSGTGIVGMRLANLALYHHPYINFPDVVVYDSGILKSDEAGVKLSGYFGNDWSLEKGEFISQ